MPQSPIVSIVVAVIVVMMVTVAIVVFLVVKNRDRHSPRLINASNIKDDNLSTMDTATSNPADRATPNFAAMEVHSEQSSNNDPVIVSHTVLLLYIQV